MRNPLARFLPKTPAPTKQLEVTEKSWPLYFGGGTIQSNWPVNWWQAGKDPTGNNSTAIVHACVDAYAQTIATLPAYHHRYAADHTRERITTSAASRTVLRPNSYQTRSDIYLNAVKSLMLRGNAYIYGVRNDRNEIAAMHQLHPMNTQPYIDAETKSVFYATGDNPLVGDIDYMIPARDICHIRLYCPNHPLVGVSPITNAAATIAANSAITNQQALFFANMSRPSGVLSTDQKLTKDQMLQLRAAWEEQSKGINTGGIPVLGGGMKWSQMAISSQDAQLVEAFKMTVEDVARAFRVPLPLVGDQSQSTYNNVEQLIAHWLSGGLGFVLDHVENNLDRFFNLPITEKIEFDADMLLRTDFQARVESYSKSITSGLMAPNEARARFAGLPSVPHGDKPIVQQQMVPLGWTETQPQETPAPAPAPEPELDEEEQRGATIHYLKKAMSNHG